MATRPNVIVAEDQARPAGRPSAARAGRRDAAEPARITRTRADRVLTWAVWALTVLAAATVFPGLRGASPAQAVEALGLVAGVSVVATTGALAVSRRPTLTQGWLLLAFAFLWSLGLAAYHLLDVPAVVDGLEAARRAIAIGEVAHVLALHALLLLLLVVPVGTPPSRRWYRLGWTIGISAIAWSVLWIAIAQRVEDLAVWRSRPSLASMAGASLSQVETMLVWLAQITGLVIAGLVAMALTVRYRASNEEQRRQLAWITLGGSATLVWLALRLADPQAGIGLTLRSLFPGLAFVSLGLGFGLALFRYRLWDIDLVVRRSIVYGLLWLTIAASYSVVAAGLGLAAGATFPIEAAIVITVAATLIFQPARRRLERAADRWVFGRRDPPIAAIHAFGEIVGGAEGPGDVAAELATTAARAMGLAWVEVAIEGGEPVVVGTSNGEAATSVPIAWRAEGFGTLRCRPVRGGRISPDDTALLESLVAQAALAISRARLAARIVQAQEQERRRIERDIHDGAQQDLAALIARLSLARSRAGEDRVMRETLDGIQRDVRRILADLRELAQGIHPSVLRDGGLVAAIEDRCARLP
ncbi:MAG TPA: histidine kinase dimerization/phosphoacceptor domain-containing protein, partial [Candidatus Limnocylindrales bacterium]|nr:histidine kinase dimerization/phosphoacceptor domain-containing protein [Candidatus Limnocylindrales bacterium]